MKILQAAASLALLLGQAGYSHLQLSPLQRSNPGAQWWKRYQPIDSTVIKGLGSEAELQALTRRAHGCGVKVIADVVFNHMANLRGGNGYADGNRQREQFCWLGACPTCASASGCGSASAGT